MPRVTGAAFLLAAFLVIFAACLPAAEGEKSEAAAKAAEAFESLYGKDWTRVKSTSDVRDDNELAKKLFAAAKEAKDQPEFLAILCEKACELAANPMGYATAAEALELEAAGVPEKASAVAARLVEIRQKQFDASKGDDRATAGEALMEALLPVADAREKVPDAVGAVALLRRALAAATVAKSDRRTEIEARLKTLEQSLRTAREIEDMKRLLEADPNKVAARERLVRIYIVDLDDPAQAAKWVQGVEDASLTKYVPGAAKPLAEAPEYACLELGEWYRGLAENAPVYAKAAMFARAQAYYNRFIELHAAADLDRTKAKAALQKIETDLSKAPATPPTPTKQPKEPAKEGKWIDILALVDPAKDAVQGTWERRDGTLRLAAPGDWARIQVPVILTGSYEMRVKLKRDWGNEGVNLLLPVGAAKILLFQGAWSNSGCGLANVNGKDHNESTVNSGIDNGREYELLLKVLLDGDAAEITARRDGKPFMHWRGPVSALSIRREWEMREGGCPALQAWQSVPVCREMQVRMLSGEAKLLRPGEKPAVPEKPGTAKQHGPKGEPGKWIDLLAGVDPDKDAVKGTWRKDGGTLVIAGGTDWGRIELPVALAGGYELQIRFVRTSGDSTVAVVLPVASSVVALNLSPLGGKVSGLDQVRGKNVADNETTVRPGTLENGRPYDLGIKVALAGAEARIEVTLDGKPYIRWQGPQSVLSVYQDWRVPHPGCIGLGTYFTVVEFQSARLRMLSGEARPLRPAG